MYEIGDSGDVKRRKTKNISINIFIITTTTTTQNHPLPRAMLPTTEFAECYLWGCIAAATRGEHQILLMRNVNRSAVTTTKLETILAILIVINIVAQCAALIACITTTVDTITGSTRRQSSLVSRVVGAAARRLLLQ